MKIKVCGLTNKENISEVLELGPEYIGFIFYPASPRYIMDKLKPEDLGALESTVKKTGVFVNSDFNEILGLTRKYNLDCVQLHGDESPELCKQLNLSGIEIIKAFSLKEGFVFQSVKDFIPFCSHFLFDSSSELKGGSGKKFNWGLIGDYALGHPFFLSGGIAPDDVDEILEINHPLLKGVDLNSRFESQIGIKDIFKLKDFITELRKKNYE